MQLSARRAGPAVTKANSDGTAAEVAISTVYPVLADNLFPHTAASVAANKAYTYTVTIPNTPCAKCTLQLLQFMANTRSTRGLLRMTVDPDDDR